ncbi:hypothetical protein GCM10020369_47390 [Cryptosporangium minutisporangium]|uniref:Uncharacterized protein n=1 Tax=Cryptosporangium minutisporangium TaxID=113569 RepID=A0ABP6T3Q8_9ACTN
MIDVTRSSAATQQGQQRIAVTSGSFGDHLDPSVGRIPGPTDQSELQRAAPRPPPEADSLNPATDPRGQSNRVGQRYVLGVTSHLTRAAILGWFTRVHGSAHRAQL